MNQRLKLRGKILSFIILLSAMITICFISLNVEASSDDQYEDNIGNANELVSPQADFNSVFTFTPISDTECDVRLTDKTATKAIIPEKIKLDGKEYEVTGIAGNGFTSASKLELVRLPKSVKTIGANAFANCKALTSLTLPAVEIIGANAFAMTKMEYLIIPTSVTSVASTILRGANTKVYVRSALEEGTTVPEGWVANWNGSNKNQDVEFDSDFIPEVKYELVSTEIQTFALGDDVEERNDGYYVSGYQEFCTIDTDDYKEVYIPATYTGEDGIERPIIGIASGAFYFNDINKLTIGYSENPIILETDSFVGLNGNVITINRGVLLESESMVSDGEQSQVVISENVFSNSTVSTIILPNTLTAIGNNMFDGCENLRDIHFIEPDGTLSSLAEANIILNLISTQKVILPDTMTYIGASAFALTHNILELYIPNSVSIVGKDIINSWKSNQTVYVDFERSNSVFDTWDKDWAYGSGTENTAKIVYKLSDTKYTITYNIDTQYHNNPNEYISDQGLDLKPVIKTGYTFEGWYLDENFENPVENIAVGTTGNLTLFAKLTPNSYNIKYDKNTPELASNPILGEMDESNHTYNVESLLSANKYTLKGWTFIGWNTKADGTGDSYEDLAPVTTLADSGVKLLYAQWTQKEYKIEYLGNRPNNATSILEGNMNPETHLFEEKFNLKKVAYQLNGWTFTGWNTKEDGTGITYLDEEIVSGLTETNIKLYAQWEVTTYIVEYEKNQPSNTEFIVNGVMEPSKHIYDVSSFLRTNAFELEGYTFVGWNTKADGSGNAFTNGAAIESLTSNGSIKLYAQWQANTYTIQYKPNRPNSSELVIGETASSSHRVDEEGILSINGFTIKGWTFKGWNTKTDGSGISYSNKENVKNVITIASSIELYAQWEAKTFAIKYEGNVPRLASEEVNGIMDNSNYTVDSTGVLAENKYTLKGWKFTGWNIKADGTGTSYADKSQIKIATDDSTVILYAQWEAKQFSIQYEPSKPLTASKEVIGITRDSIHSDKEYKELVENCYTLVGWTFTGWNTKADGSGTSYADKAQVKIATDDSIIVLYAQWQAKSYVIEYRQNKPSTASSAVIGETSNSNHIMDTEKSLTPNEFKLQGWNFVGWNTKADGTGTPYTDKAQVKIATNDSIVILYAQWEAKEFFIQYEPNKPVNASEGVNGIMENSKYTVDVLRSLLENKYTLKGWTFTGWNTKVDGTGISYADKAEVKIATDDSIVILYAQWEANQFSIQYEPNKPMTASEEVNGIMDNSNYTADSTGVLAENKYTLKGWLFTGWNSKADGSGISYADKAQVKIATDDSIVILYAQWQASEYTVTYSSNKPLNTNFVIIGDMEKTNHRYDTISKLRVNAYTLEGYKFTGWNTRADGSGTSYSNEAEIKTLSTSGTIELFAQWTPNTYVINYKPNRPTNASNPVNGETKSSIHTIDIAKTLASNEYELLGWTFTGWNTKADGTGDSYQNTTAVLNLTTEDEIVELYAQWQAKSYVIEYKQNKPSTASNAVIGETSNSNHLMDTEKLLTPNGFKLQGWNFVGWNTKADGSGKSYTNNYNIKLASNDDSLTLYAQWQVNTFIIEYRQNKPVNASKLVTGETASSHHTSDEFGRLTSNGFELQGWEFIGWNTQADGSGTAYSNNYNIKLALDSSSLLLYAQWSANTYTIEYIFNKPTNASTPINDKMTISQLKVDTVSKLANNSFEIKGWTFTGWNTKADGSGTSYANGYSTNFTYEKNAIVSLYAQWRANTYTIKYNSGQGTGTMNSTTHYYDSPAPLGECTFIYLGRTIKRWNTKVDGSGISYSKDDMVKNLTSNDGEVVNLYAQWETNDYKVVYFSNKPTNASHNVLGQMANSNHKVDTYSPLSKNTFTLKGWTFIGWNTKADGTGDSYTDQQSVVNLIYEEDGEVQLYAQWRAHTYTIKYVNTPPKNNTGFTNEYTLPETTTHVYDTPSPINGAYTLVSWKMIAWTYNGRNLNPNQMVTDLTDVDGGVITLTAFWVDKNVHDCLNSDGVYEIATENQLRGISTSINYSYKLICDLNVGDWTPISTFYGELYLGDYKITYKNTSLETNKSYGFILRNYGKISGGKFYPSITQKTVDSSQTTNIAVGGVVAYNYGSLNSVYVMSTFGQNNSYVTAGYARVDIDVRSNNCVVGGVAGYNYGYISSCRNEASIAGSHYIGGIVGSNEDHAEIYVSTNYGTLWFCLLATGNKFVGGIAGQNWDNTTMMHNNNYGELRFACKSSNNSSIVYMGKLTGWCHRGGTLEFNHGYGKVTYDTSYSDNVVTLGEFGKISNSPNYDY